MDTARPNETPRWLWINLLSLDAPLVAVVWQDFLARCYPSMLRPAGRWMLGLTVWAIYLADHLLDTSLIPIPRGVKQVFYRRYFRLACCLLVLILAADAWIALSWLRPEVLINGVLVGAAVCLYLIIFAGRKMHGPWKSRAAAALFTAGVFVVAWTGTDQPGQTLLWPAAAFCALCWGNLTLIRCWTLDGDAAVAAIPMLCFATICLLTEHSQWFAALGISAAAMATLAIAGRHMSGHAKRVLIDALLLSPLLFMWR